MNRIIFAVQNAWKKRHLLKEFLTNPKLQLTSLNDLTVEMIEAAHVAVVVLDFDGVLAPHDANTPTPEAQKWLQKLCISIGEPRIAILTNKAKLERLRYFREHFPGIQVVQGVAKKPYPDGLWEIANFRGIESSRLLLIDDRLLTGMLAATLAPCQARYFSKPLRSFKKHFFKEIFFSLLRSTERFWIQALGTCCVSTKSR